MPIEFDYNEEKNALYLRVHGELDSKEIIEYFNKLLKGKFLRKDFVEIVDLNETEDITIRYTDVEEIIRLTRDLNNIGQKATIMCGYNTVSRGISTMMLPLYQSADFNYFICSTEEELDKYLAALKL